MTRGKFIVLEGVDGAGTTTHSNLLVEALGRNNKYAHLTREPTTGPIGTMIRQVLNRRLGVQRSGEHKALCWQTMALLFAADRMDHVEAEIEPALASGVHVICDRYVYSSVAYQSLTSGEESDVSAWIKEINAYAMKPDLTLVLTLSPEESAKRRQARGGDPDIYEEDGLQAKLTEFYQNFAEIFPNDPIVYINANQSIDKTHQEIWSAIEAL